MAKQQKLQQYIFKVSSNLLAKNNFDLQLPIERARKVPGLIVALADSQLLTWLNELNHTENNDEEAKKRKKEIKYLKKLEATQENKRRLKQLYSELYDLKFVQDYVCVIIENNKQYDQCNESFKINGITYKRLLCTVGGVKTSEVVYCNIDKWDELNKRIDNGRNHNKELVGAKLGAYQALCSSASVPVSNPNGVIIVSDCITKFKDNYINIDDSDRSQEPIVSFMENQDIENNCCDGCGMILPSLARRWYGELENGKEGILSGCNIRCSWTKGMVYCFDFIDFAEKVAGTYIIKDVWGIERDIRNAEMILTESQLKLWDCYNSWEDYWANCEENKYTFRIAKTAPNFSEMDNVRQLNYQFIGCLDMTDDDINELVSPTVDEIKDIMSFDHRKSLVYLCGKGLNERTYKYADTMCQAMMIEPKLINDSFVRNRIKKMIARRINDAKIGVLDVVGNFQILSGDLYALCEHMFGMEVHGLLKAGEIYSKFWDVKNVKRVFCARAPMSNAHSLLSRNICNNEDAKYWFRYIESCAILNAWDMSCFSLNGCDFDGDLIFTTNNEVLLRRQSNLPALNCIQYKAKKCIIEDDEELIRANKNGFGSKIGSITNRITQMTSLMANYQPDDEEYKILKYRTQCGQAQQQAEIDKAKGIVSNPMPKSWYIWKENEIQDEDDAEIIERKTLYQHICAHKKPYFFQWNYATLHSDYCKYMTTANEKSILLFGKSLNDVLYAQNPTDDEQKFITSYYNRCDLDFSPSTMNRICWKIESEFNGQRLYGNIGFDGSMFKTDKEYSNEDYNIVLQKCKEYKHTIAKLTEQLEERPDNKQLLEMLVQGLHESVFDEDDLCNILVDLCYQNLVNKQILWEICGDTIIQRLLRTHNNRITYPVIDDMGEFECCGHRFHMEETQYDGGDENARV